MNSKMPFFDTELLITQNGIHSQKLTTHFLSYSTIPHLKKEIVSN